MLDIAMPARARLMRRIPSFHAIVERFIYALVFLSSPGQKTVPVGVTIGADPRRCYSSGTADGCALPDQSRLLSPIRFRRAHVAGLTGSVKG